MDTSHQLEPILDKDKEEEAENKGEPENPFIGSENKEASVQNPASDPSKSKTGCCPFARRKKREMDQVDAGAFDRRITGAPYIDGPEGYIENGEIDFKPRQGSRFDINLYSTKKTAANGLMDIALLMANASQLKQIIKTEGEHRFYVPMVILISLSIVFQIIIGLLLLYLGQVNIGEAESDQEFTKKRRRADKINNWIVAGIFLLTVVNIFISAFGLSEQGPHPRRRS